MGPDIGIWKGIYGGGMNPCIVGATCGYCDAGGRAAKAANAAAVAAATSDEGAGEACGGGLVKVWLLGIVSSCAAGFGNV